MTPKHTYIKRKSCDWIIRTARVKCLGFGIRTEKRQRAKVVRRLGHENQISRSDKSLCALSVSALFSMAAIWALTCVVSPERMLWTAKWRATSDDEHAVSRLMLGPFKSKNHEIRFEIMAVPILPFAS